MYNTTKTELYSGCLCVGYCVFELKQGSCADIEQTSHIDLPDMLTSVLTVEVHYEDDMHACYIYITYRNNKQF